MKRWFLFALFLAFLLMVSACSQQKSSVSKEYTSDNNWNTTVSLSWGSSEVIGIIKTKYKGLKPLDYVVVEPQFQVSGWPEGYIPPNSGRYTWKSENIEGDIPDIQDTSTRSNAQLSIRPPRTMSVNEANKILEQVKVNIEWKETHGEIFKTTINLNSFK